MTVRRRRTCRQRHDRDKRRRHGPQRASAELSGNQADGGHRQQVIDAAERMQEAGKQAMPAMPGMGECDTRRKD
jgi:hypothetical protein